MIYIFILCLLLFLSYHYDVCGARRGYREWCTIILIAFILIAGLRWRLGVDTPNYIYSFFHMPKLNKLSGDDLGVTYPLWRIINSIVLTLFGKFYVLQFIHATFINVLYFKYIKRHSQYVFTCLFFYFLLMYTGHNMEIMKASISIVICLYANDYILEKKWVRAYLLYMVAAFFHASTYLIFLTPLLLFLRLNKKGIIILISAFIIAYLVQLSLGDYVALFDMAGESISDKVESYVNREHYSSRGGNFNFFIVYISPLLLYPLYCLYIVKKKKANMELLHLEPFLLLGTVFLMAQMNMQIFYRYVDFYSMYFVLFLSEMVVISIKNSPHGQKSFACVKTSLFFLPLLLLTLYGYKEKYVRYYPYSSIIERKIDKSREQYYSRGFLPSPNPALY